MVESIWRYPLKSAQGEALPRVFIGPDGPAGDRAWACLSADGMIVSAKHPRRWGRMLYVLAMLMAPGRGDGVFICVPGAEPLRAGTAAADDALSAWLGERVRLTAEVPAQARLHRLWPHRIRVGREVTLRVLVPTPRCAVPGAAQPGLPSAPGLLRAIGRRRVNVPGLGRAACLGSYAQVLSAGTVAVGDPADVSSWRGAIGPPVRRPAVW